ncbi:hypothetical protein [Massilia sp. TWP1-3-3]|uniref:hypothetical protein n=1 Tax=Massilia sp. TWP1-3-3 TaxID=2804573 RepID=UPI003CF4EE08
MHPKTFPRLVWFFFLSGSVLAQAHGAPVALSPPDIATFISQISRAGAGRICLAGETMDPDGDLQTRGKIILFNTDKNQVVWQQTIDAPEEGYMLGFAACRSDGTFTYVAGNVQTNSSPSLSQTLAYVYKFDQHGKLLGKKELLVGGRNAFVYDLDLDRDASALTVVGMVNDRKGASQLNAIYFARLDTALKKATYSKLATGAFMNGSTVKLAAKSALLGGSFLPATAADTAAVNDYAVSKIVGDKYQFSVRPQAQTGHAQDVATAISPADEVVSLADARGVSTLTVVGADGKLAPALTFKSSACKVTSMSASAEVVYAVRASCAKAGQGARLMAFSRKTGLETGVAGIVGEPVFSYPIDGALHVVSRKADKVLLLQTIAKP